jgi:zinc transporter ZupT
LGLIVPGLATGLGGVAVLMFRRPNALILDTLLGFAAGVMLAATAFSLLVPALDHGSLSEVLLGFALGSGLSQPSTCSFPTRTRGSASGDGRQPRNSPRATAPPCCSPP